MAKLHLAYIECHPENGDDDIFFPTVVYLGKQRETNWGLVSNCQGKQHCRTLHLSRVDGFLKQCAEGYQVIPSHGFQSGYFSKAKCLESSHYRSVHRSWDEQSFDKWL